MNNIDFMYWIIYQKGEKLLRTMQPITHRLHIAVSQFETMKRTGSLYKKFKKPEELTIITCHNYGSRTLFEQNMDYLGIEDYVVMGKEYDIWKCVYKIGLVLEYMNSNVKKTPYILICDACDVIIKDDPRKIIHIFKYMNFDILFGSTMYYKDWEYMPDKHEWAKSISKKEKRYLNAGVCIGKWDFVKKVFAYASKYVVPDSLYDCADGRARHISSQYGTLSNFPEGAGEQTIFRYIHDKFYPRMDIDYNNYLIYRN